MSVTIHWRPVSEKTSSFSGGTSTCLNVLKELYNGVIGENDIPALRAMAVATNNQFYREVADVIEKVSSIRVWGAY